MCIINGYCSFMKKNTLNYIWNWKAVAVCAASQRWGRHRDINQLKWNSIRQILSSRPNWAVFHIVVMLPLWKYSSSNFPLDPKSILNQLSCQRSLLFCSGLFALRLRPPRPLFRLRYVTLCWCFRSVGHYIQCAAPFIFGEELLFCI